MATETGSHGTGTGHRAVTRLGGHRDKGWPQERQAVGWVATEAGGHRDRQSPSQAAMEEAATGAGIGQASHRGSSGTGGARPPGTANPGRAGSLSRLP